MEKKYFIAISLCFLISISQAQTKGITPMHQFFKQYADSTIIVEYPTDSYASPSYNIICKTNNFISCYTYKPVDTDYANFYKREKKFPIVLWTQLMSLKVNYKNRPAEINTFFNLTDLPDELTDSFWRDVQEVRLWGLADDKTFGNGCPKDKPRAVILDGPVAIIYLITKKEIKMLQFDNPWGYEEQCPGNKNRQAVIKFYKLLDQYLP